MFESEDPLHFGTGFWIQLRRGQISNNPVSQRSPGQCWTDTEAKQTQQDEQEYSSGIFHGLWQL